MRLYERRRATNALTDAPTRTLALIGGSGGLGRKLRPLLEQDYRVVALSSKDLDITNANAVERWMLENGPEIVLNAAVRNADATVHRLDHNDTRIQLDVGVRGLTNVLRYALPMMRASGYGRVIHFSSIVAKEAIPGTAVYAAGKAYGEQLCRVAAAENAGKGVTVNCIRLGYFDGGLKDLIPEDIQAKILASIPMKRWGTIGELYNAVRFLVDTEYVTGTCLEIAGGL